MPTLPMLYKVLSRAMRQEAKGIQSGKKGKELTADNVRDTWKITPTPPHAHTQTKPILLTNPLKLQM